ncbi:MAG: hypothetical protein IJA08_07120 [Clostridia bacterium]|nr:hypothetical protein [Clostridia bacterium]
MMKRILTAFLAVAVFAAIALTPVSFATTTYVADSEDTLVSLMTFDTVTANGYEALETAAVAKWTKSASNYTGLSNKTFSSSFYKVYGTGAAIENKTNADRDYDLQLISPDPAKGNGFFIDNGRLKMTLNTTPLSDTDTSAPANQLELDLRLNNSGYNTGKLRIAFDYTSGDASIPTDAPSAVCYFMASNHVIKHKGDMLILTSGGADYTIATGINQNVTCRLELLFDYDYKDALNAAKTLVTVTGTVGGVTSAPVSVVCGDAKSSNIRLQAARPSSMASRTVYLDNIKASIPKTPALASSNVATKSGDVWTGTPGVSLDAPTMTFDTPLMDSAISAVNLYCKGEKVTDPQITLSADKKTITVGKALTYSTLYTLEIPAHAIMAENRAHVPGISFNFITAHEPITLTMGAPAYTDESGTPIVELGTLTTVKVSATLNEVSGTDTAATLIVAVYDASGVMKKVASASETVTGGTPKDIEVTLSGLPTEKTGWTLKTYLWNSLTGMRKLADPADL